MSESEFVVKDKRHFDSEGGIKDAETEEKASPRKEKDQSPADQYGGQKADESGTCGDSPPLPEVNFSTFVFSLSTSALMNLGELPDPNTRQSCQNIPLAKQTIDILGMLKEKTKGNLDHEEEHLLSNLLYELRMKYVAAVKK